MSTTEKTCFLDIPGTHPRPNPFVDTVESLKNKRIVQETTQNRLNRAQPFMDVLASTIPPKNPTTQQVSKIVQLENRIGGGTFGTVCKVSLRGALGENPFFFAMKTLEDKKLKKRDPNFDEIVAEALITKALSSLVRRNECPHYALCLHAATRFDPQEGALVIIFMELGTFTLAQMLERPTNSTSAPLSINHIMSLIFQMLFGLLKMGSSYDMVHNDLYLENILINSVLPNAMYQYQIEKMDGSKYRFDVALYGSLAKLIDFSWASSNAYYQILTTHAHSIKRVNANQYFKPLKDLQHMEGLLDIGNPNKRSHILYHTYINAYARDILTLLSGLLFRPIPQVVKNWCNSVIEVISEDMAREAESPSSLRNSAYLTVDTLSDLMIRIFDPLFLDDCGISPLLFSHKSLPASQTFSLSMKDLNVYDTIF